MASGALVERYIDATVSTPAGTAIAAPQSTTIVLGPIVLLEVELKIPPGHSGLTGWRLDLANVTVIPYAGINQWVTGDDDRLPFTFNRETGLGLKVVTYNLGQYPHSHICRMKVTDLPNASSAPSAGVRIASL